MSEFRTLQGRIASTTALVDRNRIAQPDDGLAFLGIVTTLGNYPVVPQSVYILTAVSLGSNDQEGSGVTVQVLGGPIYALNVGSIVPPTGVKVMCQLVGGRWIFRYDG